VDERREGRRNVEGWDGGRLEGWNGGWMEGTAADLQGEALSPPPPHLSLSLALVGA